MTALAAAPPATGNGAHPQAPLGAAVRAGTMSPGGIAKLLDALNKAVLKLDAGVPKHGENKHFGYKYPKAEDVIAFVRPALAENGITVFAVDSNEPPPSGAPLAPADSGVGIAGRPTWRCGLFIVGHKSGEWLIVGQQWPVVPEKGRPLDKAWATTDTSGLKYLYMRLLMLPVSDGENDDATPEQAAAAAQASQVAKAKAAPAKNPTPAAGSTTSSAATSSPSSGTAQQAASTTSRPPTSSPSSTPASGAATAAPSGAPAAAADAAAIRKGIVVLVVAASGKAASAGADDAQKSALKAAFAAELNAAAGVALIANGVFEQKLVTAELADKIRPWLEARK